jgi:Ca2+/Na+ antiporter
MYWNDVEAFCVRFLVFVGFIAIITKVTFQHNSTRKEWMLLSTCECILFTSNFIKNASFSRRRNIVPMLLIWFYVNAWLFVHSTREDRAALVESLDADEEDDAFELIEKRLHKILLLNNTPWIVVWKTRIFTFFCILWPFLTTQIPGNYLFSNTYLLCGIIL